MRPDFAMHLSGFLGKYLPDIKGASAHTISAYSDTFRLFLFYCQSEVHIRPERLYIKDISCSMVAGFLDWIEKERGCSVSTRNQRFAAICSFLRYAQVYSPACSGEIQKILMLPVKKKEAADIQYISFEDMKHILAQPDCRKKEGRRDRCLLCLLYDTGARVSELTALRVRDVRLVPPARVTLYGKGRKRRCVPLTDETKECLEQYMSENNLLETESHLKYLFANRSGEGFTRAGISYILKKYTEKARIANPGIPERITPHVLRHSKAMHLLQAGVNIIYIKDILGHTDIATTQIYLKADMKMKKEALEKVKIGIQSEPGQSVWAMDTDLMEWLTQLGKDTRR